MSSKKVEFEVMGAPTTQGNHRVGRQGQIYDSNKNLHAWRTLLFYEARRTKVTFEHAVRIQLGFRFERPPSHLRKDGDLRTSAPILHQQKPDIDKLIRPVLDALTHAGMLVDDCRVVEVHGEKVWHQSWSGVRIVVEEVLE